MPSGRVENDSGLMSRVNEGNVVMVKIQGQAVGLFHGVVEDLGSVERVSIVGMLIQVEVHRTTAAASCCRIART